MIRSSNFYLSSHVWPTEPKITSICLKKKDSTDCIRVFTNDNWKIHNILTLHSLILIWLITIQTKINWFSRLSSFKNSLHKTADPSSFPDCVIRNIANKIEFEESTKPFKKINVLEWLPITGKLQYPTPPSVADTVTHSQQHWHCFLSRVSGIFLFEFRKKLYFKFWV